jgi:hypothetical protein
MCTLLKNLFPGQIYGSDRNSKWPLESMAFWFVWLFMCIEIRELRDLLLRVGKVKLLRTDDEKASWAYSQAASMTLNHGQLSLDAGIAINGLL